LEQTVTLSPRRRAEILARLRDLTLQVQQARLVLQAAEQSYISYLSGLADGHGMPTAGLVGHRQDEEKGTLTFIYAESVSEAAVGGNSGKDGKEKKL
jgi:hypothetical protein